MFLELEYLGREEMVELDSADQTGEPEEVRRMAEFNEADTVRLGAGRAEMLERQQSSQSSQSSASTFSNLSWCESPETCHTWDMQSVVTTES